MILPIIFTIENEDQRNAIEQIYLRYYKLLVADSNKILHNINDAEDAIMNTFKYLSEYPDNYLDYEDDRTIKTIILKARCISLDKYRQNKRKNSRNISLEDENDLYEIEDSEQDLSQIAVSQENIDKLTKALNQLKPMYRIPVYLKYFQHLNAKQIAKELNVNENTVYWRLHEAIRQMKNYLNDIGFEYET